jgi:hypothetical protein
VWVHKSIQLLLDSKCVLAGYMDWMADTQRLDWIIQWQITQRLSCAGTGLQRCKLSLRVSCCCRCCCAGELTWSTIGWYTNVQGLFRQPRSGAGHHVCGGKEQQQQQQQQLM